MPNYAEEMAYWYLRLNGFFPLTNFVYHRLPIVEHGRVINADADILAVRPPHYRETIFSDEHERDLESDERFNEFDGCWVGVIAEVKGSRNVTMEQVNRAFSPERLRVAIMRLGLLDNQMVNEAVEILRYERQYPANQLESVLIMKVLFTDTPTLNYSVMQSISWFTIGLREVDNFIRRRIRDYPDAKSGGRYFFPDTLFQYIVWHERPEHYE